MSHVDHFSYGLITPVLAYVMSSIGCVLGLLLTMRARLSTGPSRLRRLIGGALSIGVTGVWGMHFIAMTGFTVGGPIRYDVPLTAGSAVPAVVVAGAGLFMASHGGERLIPLLGGGLFTGLGMAGMHYAATFAMNTAARISYDPLLVGFSVVIAIAASTVALWFTQRVGGALATGGAGLIMAIAVCGMHYVGMFAMEVQPQISLTPVAGARGSDFMLPALIVISVLTLILLLTVVLSPSEQEQQDDAALLAQLETVHSTDKPLAPAVSRRRPRPPRSG
ncbi:NO-binding membrane sensor protein with MHYT domain [Streptosporangium album]|uniref:NO-binding membrane sensor protein with MHYT domain n=1 Tax=Streptosporangium album TaxID=47479 RepID=A0A7W7WCK0_9ACTN|nr:MHYT domain-containing protein [Streptosporangium album]MBB4941339.1 NO-binding membrane sensor protein with MHYT domain [Streptosporangium album]